jgi:small multidrug resistance pump
MGWRLLVIGALLEAAGSICLRLSQGLSKTSYAAAGLLCFVISLVPFCMALRRSDLSSAYAMWSALDLAIVTLVGILWMQESANLSKIVALALIGAGVILLNVSHAV